MLFTSIITLDKGKVTHNRLVAGPNPAGPTIFANPRKGIFCRTLYWSIPKYSLLAQPSINFRESQSSSIPSSGIQQTRDWGMTHLCFFRYRALGNFGVWRHWAYNFQLGGGQNSWSYPILFVISMFIWYLHFMKFYRILYTVYDRIGFIQRISYVRFRFHTNWTTHYRRRD